MPANHLLRVPTLRRKKTGNHFVRFFVDGRPQDHSLGSDPAIAQLRYKAKLADWAAGREALSQKGAAAPTPDPAGLRVAELARMMLDSYLAKGRLQAERGFRKHLTRFLRVHGAAEVLALTTPAPERGRFAPPVIRLLEALAEDLGRPTVALGGPYAPRTINHDLNAARRLFNWGAARGFCPPIAWHGLHRVKVPRSQPEDRTPDQVRAMLAAALKLDPRLAPYIALSYLCLLRPSEAIRLVLAKKTPGGRVSAPNRRRSKHRSDASSPFGLAIGRFREVRDRHGKVRSARGLFELFLHKNAWRRVEERDGRYIVLTDEALHWFDLAEPIWSHPSNLTRACTRVTGFPPHVLRDSGASHLRALGVAGEDVDQLLGHNRPGELLTYARVPWHTLRASAGRLTLR